MVTFERDISLTIFLNNIYFNNNQPTVSITILRFFVVWRIIMKCKKYLSDPTKEIFVMQICEVNSPRKFEEISNIEHWTKYWVILIVSNTEKLTLLDNDTRCSDLVFWWFKIQYSSIIRGKIIKIDFSKQMMIRYFLQLSCAWYRWSIMVLQTRHD